MKCKVLERIVQQGKPYEGYFIASKQLDELKRLAKIGEALEEANNIFGSEITINEGYDREVRFGDSYELVKWYDSQPPTNEKECK